MPNGIAKERALDRIREEYAKARETHAPMHSAHEGWAILREEVDELWDEVKMRDHNYNAMRKEAVQIGAMALAFITEVCDRHVPGNHEQEEA